MEIRHYKWDVVDSNSWLVVENDHGLLFDVIFSEELFEALKELDSVLVVLTHAHFDHVVGLNRLRMLRPDVKVLATSLTSEFIGSEQKNLSSIADAFMAFYLKKDIETMDSTDYKNKFKDVDGFTCKPADMTFDNEMNFDWEGHSVYLSQYSGHSPDGLIAILDGKFMFSGDTILGIPTATRLPKGSTSKFWNNDIPRLKTLASTIEEVYPGHGDPGKLSDMIELNEKARKK